MQALLVRLAPETMQTLGQFYLFEEIDRLYECKTLELPWLNNQRMVSCIPTGDYILKKRWTPKYQDHFHVLNPDGSELDPRDHILVHWGNYHHQIKGCILVGRDHADINKDGLRDVSSSRRTMRFLNKHIDEDKIPFTIINL